MLSLPCASRCPLPPALGCSSHTAPCGAPSIPAPRPQPLHCQEAPEMPPTSAQAAGWELLALHRRVTGSGAEPPPGQQPDAFPQTSGSFFQLCRCPWQPGRLPKAGRRGQRVAVMGWARSRWSKPVPSSRQPGDGGRTRAAQGRARGAPGAAAARGQHSPGPGYQPGVLARGTPGPHQARAAQGLGQARLTPSGTPAQRPPPPPHAGLAGALPVEP